MSTTATKSFLITVIGKEAVFTFMKWYKLQYILTFVMVDNVNVFVQNIKLPGYLDYLKLSWNLRITDDDNFEFHNLVIEGVHHEDQRMLNIITNLQMMSIATDDYQISYHEKDLKLPVVAPVKLKLRDLLTAADVIRVEDNYIESIMDDMRVVESTGESFSYLQTACGVRYWVDVNQIVTPNDDGELQIEGRLSGDINHEPGMLNLSLAVENPLSFADVVGS